MAVVLRTSTLPVVSPADAVLQKRVLRSFWIKTQLNEVLNPESMYRYLAIRVLEIAAEKGYDVNQLESACKRFEKSPQFGDRIETANFFDDEAEKLHPYSWYLAQVKLGYKPENFDAYRVPNVGKPMWKLHDGNRVENLECVVFGGVSQLLPVQQVKQPESTPNDRTELEQVYHDYNLKCVELEQVKLDLLAAKNELERAKNELERAKNDSKRMESDKAIFDVFGRFEGFKEIIDRIINDDENFTYTRNLQKKAQQHELL